MHPTTDEQLAGARRLLDVVLAEPDLGAAVREQVTNANRLVGQVARTWATQPALHRTAAAATVALLTSLGRPATTAEPETDSPRDLAAYDSSLRAELASFVRGLPTGVEGDAARQAVLTHLRSRLETGLV